ncbi:ribonuclease D [SAR202 cluster bacterium AC-409-J13_OGT_754m]|nr:ribonuclease D [SAR202 cluster bacterium AC-409-J13_OGT_754m]
MGKRHLPVQFIKDATQLSGVLSVLKEEPAVALDTESNSRHGYPEKVCLIQISASSGIYLVDTLAVKNLDILGSLLHNPSIIKVMHGSDYDVRCLDRQWNFRITNLFDTGVAARFVGVKQVGLASLIKELLGIEIIKDSKIQKSDWASRPLSAAALRYAAEDVRYLIELRNVLQKRMENLGREGWVKEEFERLEAIHYVAPNLETAFLSVKGSYQLDGRGRAILKRLFALREEEACKRNIPPYYVIPHDALIAIASAGSIDLDICLFLKHEKNERLSRLIQRSVVKGMEDPPIYSSLSDYPSRTGMSISATNLLNQLKVWRSEKANTLNIDPSLVWSMPSLKRISRCPGSFRVEQYDSGIRRWQRKMFSLEIESYLP